MPSLSLDEIASLDELRILVARPLEWLGIAGQDQELAIRYVWCHLEAVAARLDMLVK